MRPAGYDDVRAFCRVDGWSRTADAPGRVTRKHEAWAKALADGMSLRCVISMGGGEYSPQMMSWIIKQELRTTEQQFWAAVRDGAAPALPQARPARPQRELLPLSLVRALRAAGHTPDDLRGLTPEAAKRLLKP